MKSLHVLTFLLFLSCSKYESLSDQVYYHSNGQAKPKVAVIKVIDTSQSDVEWDLSSEFTEFLIEKLLSRGRFFLTDDFQMITSSQLKKLELSPFSEDMRWLLEMNSSSDFVIFTEILNHRIEAETYGSYNPLNALKRLYLSVRICVLDIRKKEPKVVLQEILTKEFIIPFNFGSYKEEDSTLNRHTFSFSPLGLAHKTMVAEISKEMEDYILIAQSNIYD
jgi:hypothetical protein